MQLIYVSIGKPCWLYLLTSSRLRQLFFSVNWLAPCRRCQPFVIVCHWAPQNGTLAGGCMVSTNYILRWDRCHSMFVVSIISVLGFMFRCFILWWWDKQAVQEGLVVGWYWYIPANASSHNLEKRPAAVELALLHRSRNGYHCDSGKLDGCSKRWSRTGSCSASKAPVFCRYHKHAS